MRERERDLEDVIRDLTNAWPLRDAAKYYLMKMFSTPQPHDWGNRYPDTSINDT